MKFILQINRVMLLAIIAIGLMLQGCIKDDLSNCHRYGVTIDFIYDYNVDDIDKFKDVVENVNLYVYEKSGALQSQHVITKAELAANNYKYDASLLEGTYDIVAWMNLTADYEVSSEGRIDRARVEVIPSTMVGEINNGMSHIYHGRIEDVVVQKAQIGYHTIELIKDTKELTVNAVFQNALAATDEIIMELTSTHGLYNFYNDPVARLDKILYMPAYSATYPAPKQINTGLYTTVQRLWDTDDVNLKIIRRRPSMADELLLDEMITPTVMMNPSLDTNHKLDKVDKLVVDYHIVFSGGGTSIIGAIVVNGWVVVENPGPI